MPSETSRLRQLTRVTITTSPAPEAKQSVFPSLLTQEEIGRAYPPIPRGRTIWQQIAASIAALTTNRIGRQTPLSDQEARQKASAPASKGSGSWP